MLQPGRTLLSSPRIQSRVAEMASEIRGHYGAELPVLLGLMNGALFFLSDLMRNLPPEAEFQCSVVGSYEGTASSGRLQGLDTIGENLRGRRILIVDDILDTGLTLSKVDERLLELGAEEVKICVLLSKRVPRRMEVTADWVGFEIENEFVVGYGLDHNGRYRSFEDIRVLDEVADK